MSQPHRQFKVQQSPATKLRASSQKRAGGEAQNLVDEDTQQSYFEKYNKIIVQTEYSNSQKPTLKEIQKMNEVYRELLKEMNLNIDIKMNHKKTYSKPLEQEQQLQTPEQKLELLFNERSKNDVVLKRLQKEFSACNKKQESLNGRDYIGQLETQTTKLKEDIKELQKSTEKERQLNKKKGKEIQNIDEQGIRSQGFDSNQIENEIRDYHGRNATLQKKIDQIEELQQKISNFDQKVSEQLQKKQNEGKAQNIFTDPIINARYESVKKEVDLATKTRKVLEEKDKVQVKLLNQEIYKGKQQLNTTDSVVSHCDMEIVQLREKITRMQDILQRQGVNIPMSQRIDSPVKQNSVTKNFLIRTDQKVSSNLRSTTQRNDSQQSNRSVSMGVDSENNNENQKGSRKIIQLRKKQPADATLEKNLGMQYKLFISNQKLADDIGVEQELSNLKYYENTRIKKQKKLIRDIGQMYSELLKQIRKKALEIGLDYSTFQQQEKLPEIEMAININNKNYYSLIQKTKIQVQFQKDIGTRYKVLYKQERQRNLLTKDIGQFYQKYLENQKFDQVDLQQNIPNKKYYDNRVEIKKKEYILNTEIGVQFKLEKIKKTKEQRQIKFQTNIGEKYLDYLKNEDKITIKMVLPKYKRDYYKQKLVQSPITFSTSIGTSQKEIKKENKKNNIQKDNSSKNIQLKSDIGMPYKQTLKNQQAKVSMVLKKQKIDYYKNSQVANQHQEYNQDLGVSYQVFQQDNKKATKEKGEIVNKDKKQKIVQLQTSIGEPYAGFLKNSKNPTIQLVLNKQKRDYYKNRVELKNETLLTTIGTTYQQYSKEFKKSSKDKNGENGQKVKKEKKQQQNPDQLVTNIGSVYGDYLKNSKIVVIQSILPKQKRDYYKNRIVNNDQSYPTTLGTQYKSNTAIPTKAKNKKEKKELKQIQFRTDIGDEYETYFKVQKLPKIQQALPKQKRDYYRNKLEAKAQTYQTDQGTLYSQFLKENKLKVQDRKEKTDGGQQKQKKGKKINVIQLHTAIGENYQEYLQGTDLPNIAQTISKQKREYYKNRLVPKVLTLSTTIGVEYQETIKEVAKPKKDETGQSDGTVKKEKKGNKQKLEQKEIKYETGIGDSYEVYCKKSKVQMIQQVLPKTKRDFYKNRVLDSSKDPLIKNIGRSYVEVLKENKKQNKLKETNTGDGQVNVKKEKVQKQVRFITDLGSAYQDHLEDVQTPKVQLVQQKQKRDYYKIKQEVKNINYQIDIGTSYEQHLKLNKQKNGDVTKVKKDKTDKTQKSSKQKEILLKQDIGESYIDYQETLSITKIALSLTKQKRDYYKNKLQQLESISYETEIGTIYKQFLEQNKLTGNKAKKDKKQKVGQTYAKFQQNIVMKVSTEEKLSNNNYYIGIKQKKPKQLNTSIGLDYQEFLDQ